MPGRGSSVIDSTTFLSHSNDTRSNEYFSLPLVLINLPFSWLIIHKMFLKMDSKWGKFSKGRRWPSRTIAEDETKELLGLMRGWFQRLSNLFRWNCVTMKRKKKFVRYCSATHPSQLKCDESLISHNLHTIKWPIEMKKSSLCHVNDILFQICFWKFYSVAVTEWQI